MKLAKAGMLLKLLFQNPKESLDRLEAIITSRLDRWLHKPPEYPEAMPEEVLSQIAAALGHSLNLDGLQREIMEIEIEVRKRMATLEHKAPFTTKHHGDLSLARAVFVACQLLKPEVVLETGVAYGVTTAFVLQALCQNQKGTLYSIDLPPLGKNADLLYVGYLVPETLRERWSLTQGVSKRVLPELLAGVGKVDIFIHDSLHTYRNIWQELNLVTPHLARPSIVIADDVQGNGAFFDWVQETRPDWWTTFQEEKKDAVVGVAIFE